VIVLVGLLLVTMLVAGARRSTSARGGSIDHDVHSFRSHAEASRGREDGEHEAARANGRT
jgi:hypothetical protein